MALNPSEKIAILMHECDSLRSEVNQRTGYGFQLAVIAVAIGAWLSSGPMHLRLWILLFLTALGLFAVASWNNVFFIWKAAERLREIESVVDTIAGEDNLLRWERLWCKPKWFHNIRRGIPRQIVNMPQDPPAQYYVCTAQIKDGCIIFPLSSG